MVKGWGTWEPGEEEEAGAKTQTQTTEEESELLVIISIPVDMKQDPTCGRPREVVILAVMFRCWKTAKV